jgi:hypothetical protein
VAHYVAPSDVMGASSRSSLGSGWKSELSWDEDEDPDSADGSGMDVDSEDWDAICGGRWPMWCLAQGLQGVVVWNARKR